MAAAWRSAASLAARLFAAYVPIEVGAKKGSPKGPLGSPASKRAKSKQAGGGRKRLHVD